MPSLQKPPGTSRVKLGLACVLGVVFVVVLTIQFGGGSDTKGASAAKSTKDHRRVVSRGASAAKAGPQGGDPQATDGCTAPWPRFRVEDVVKHDPFAVSAAFAGFQKAAAEAKPDPRQEALVRERERLERQAEQDRAFAELEREGVKVVIVGSHCGSVALIGSQTVRVGDELNGFRVVAIEPDGVVLERPPAQ
jgi:hypothetical protein